ncbi:MAG: hypothetical protein QXY62_02960 [Candidatus Altiarchaeota archaeon]
MKSTKKIFIWLFIILIFSVAVMAAFGDIFNFVKRQPEVKDTSLAKERNYSINAPVISVTAYSNNIAFIKRHGTFNSDENAEVIVLEILNFTQPIKDSLLIYDDKASLKEFYFKDVEKIEEIKENVTPEFEEILNESLGKEIKVKIDNNSFIGKLVWLSKEKDKIGIEYLDGVLFLNLYDVKEFLIPNANVEKREKSENNSVIIPALIIKEIPTYKGMHNLFLSYLREGINWDVNYKFYINSEKDEDFGTLQSWAFVKNNGNENWNNIELKLVVGYPNIIIYYSYRPVYAPAPTYRAQYLKEAAVYEEVGAPFVEEELVPESLGEFCIYSFEEPVTINASESKNLPIFSRDIKFKRKYLWNANLANEVYKIYEINNTLDAPLAEGIFSVYLKGEFEGQDKIKYTAKKASVEVKVAKAPDIIVKKEILERKEEKLPEEYSTTYGRTYATKTYYKVKLSLENHKDSDVTMLIKDEMQSGSEVNLLSSTIKPTEIKLYSLKWDNLKLNAWEKKEIIYEYEVKKYYG